MEKKGSLLLCGIFLIICSIYGYLLKSLSPEDMLYPKFVLYLLISLTIILILQVFLTKGDEFKVSIFDGFRGVQFATVVFTGLFYIIFIDIIGYFVSTLLFMFILLSLLKNSKKVSVLVTLGFCGFIFLVFKVFLGVPVPSGVIF